MSGMRRVGAGVAIGFLLCLLTLGVPITAHAHATSTSYLVADDTKAGDIALTWDVAVADVHWALDLDADGDGAITWHEVDARRADIATLAASHLRVDRAGHLCTPRLDDILLTAHAGEPHLSLSFKV